MKHEQSLFTNNTTNNENAAAKQIQGEDLTFRVYDRLCDEARGIREEVFVREQGFSEEFDDMDARSTHVVLYYRGEAVGTCRYFKNGGAWRIGRVAVRKNFRGLHAGERMIRFAEERIRAQGGSRTEISAQVRAQGFYAKCGYTAEGGPYDEEGCPHIMMKKELR